VLTSVWSGHVRRETSRNTPEAACSGRGRLAAAEWFQQVVSQAHQTPLGRHVVQTSKQKLAKSSTVFDLAEHRFDDCCSPSVLGLALLRAQLASPSSLSRSGLWVADFRCGSDSFVMLQATGGDVRFCDAIGLFQKLNVVFAEVSDRVQNNFQLLTTETPSLTGEFPSCPRTSVAKFF